MASHMFNAAKTRLIDGTIDLTVSHIDVYLCMTNTTADIENDGIVFADDLTTLDEMDGSNYVRKALTGKTVITDDANDRSEFYADDVIWTQLGAGTRQIQGALMFRYVTSFPDQPAIAWIEFASPVTADGTNFTLQWNAEGILQAA